MQRTHDLRRPSLRQQNGFTLIELMVVVAILGIMAAIAIPQYSDYLTRARLTKINSATQTIKLAIAEYAYHNGGNMSALQAGPAGFTDSMTSGGLGLSGQPSPTEEVLSYALNAGTGELDIALQGALIAPNACGANAVIRLTPRASLGGNVVSWSLSAHNAAAVCVNEIAKWK